MPLHDVLYLLLLIFVIAAAIALVRRSFGSDPRSRPRSPGLDILEERYAKGEIEREEYLKKRRDLVD